MRFCLTCRGFSGDGPLCSQCGRSFGGRLCKGHTRHLNPFDARFCNQCGTTDLQEGASALPLNWLGRALLLGAVFYGGRWLLLAVTHTQSVSFQSLTGYRDVRVWFIEKLANLLIVLLVFYFLSAFLPGEAGKAFRALMSNVVLLTVKSIFRSLGWALTECGKILLRLLGIEIKTSKKKKH